MPVAPTSGAFSGFVGRKGEGTEQAAALLLAWKCAGFGGFKHSLEAQGQYMGRKPKVLNYSGGCNLVCASCVFVVLLHVPKMLNFLTHEGKS